MYKYLIIIFIFTSTFSQNKNCYIEYNLKILEEKGLFENNSFLSENLQKVIDNKEEINFILEINDLGAKFYHNSNLSKIDKNLSNFAINLASYNGIVYNIENDSILRQSNILGKNIYVKEARVINWIYLNETKLIDEYLCYKAVSEKIVAYKDKIFKFPIIAWYCPSFPLKYGPNGYGNLPGLILELQVRNSLFGMKSLSTEKKCEFNLDFLNNVKIITPEELEKKLIEFNNFEGN